MRHFEAIILAKRAESQTIADFFLIYRMNIVGVAGIDGDGETRMGHVLRRESLGFPHLGPGIIHGDIKGRPNGPLERARPTRRVSMAASPPRFYRGQSRPARPKSANCLPQSNTAAWPQIGGAH